ncbi:hypothetical protein Tco_0261572 [Tanacetum coccineum]
MVEKSKLDEDSQGKAVDPTRYHGMIDTIMYLTSSRPDLAFVLCMCARLVSWSSKKHKSTAISSKEAEYIALSGLQFLYAVTTSNTQDQSISTSDITLSRFKWKMGVVELYFVSTEYQLADIFTKPLARERLEFLINKLGMRSMFPETLKKLADEEEE